MKWIQDDCQKLENINEFAPFDIIICMENLEHLKNPELFLKRTTQLLSQKGKLFVSVPSRNWTNRISNNPLNSKPINPYHVKEYTKEEFENLLKEYFKDISFLYQTFTDDCIAIGQLMPMLMSLWGNPFIRLGSWIKKTLFRKQTTPLQDLLPEVKLKITGTFPGDSLTVNYIAVCSIPKC